MKNLKGSEKQIAWAEKIVAEAIEKNESDMKFEQSIYDQLKDRPEYALEEKKMVLRKAVYTYVQAELDEIVSAKDIIEHRNNLKKYVIEKDVDRFLQTIGKDENVVDNIIEFFAKDGKLNPDDFIRWI